MSFKAKTIIKKYQKQYNWIFHKIKILFKIRNLMKINIK